MNNTRILSTSPFGINFSKQHNHNFNQNYEEIDERLFDTYLEISGHKNHNNNLSTKPSLCSADVSSADEESDSSYHKVSPTMNTRQHHKSNIAAASRKQKISKKEDFDSDNDSLQEFHTTTTKAAAKKSTKSINRKSSTSNSSVTSEDDSKKQKSLYKTELCRNWEETGHCRYGMKCQYAHGAADLREIDRHPKYKTQKCRTFHQTGACPYGARCTFRHFNLPGDALEMQNLEKQEKEEEEKKRQLQQQKEAAVPSVFSARQQQNWLFGQSPLAGLVGQTPRLNTTNYDAEDSLLPSNAESLLPHQLLFDLESPDEDEEPISRCPLRNYVNLPSFSHFQAAPSAYHQQQQPQLSHQQMNQEQCKTFFRPWLF